jgi:hypothetical protein
MEDFFLIIKKNKWKGFSFFFFLLHNMCSTWEEAPHLLLNS